MALNYESLSETERIKIAEDRHRRLEADHYRIAISGAIDEEARLERLERRILAVREEIAALKDKDKEHSEAPPTDLGT